LISRPLLRSFLTAGEPAIAASTIIGSTMCLDSAVSGPARAQTQTPVTCCSKQRSYKEFTRRMVK
jgi:hypothetical protein